MSIAAQFQDSFETLLLKSGLFLRHRDGSGSVGTPGGLSSSQTQGTSIWLSQKKITSILKRACLPQLIIFRKKKVMLKAF